jgi:hypothetical protein
MNRLLHKRLNDIVFVSYNRKMKTRFQIRREKKGKNIDPLVISEFDCNNEWPDSSHVPSEGVCGSDLTWQLVDEAVGASKSVLGHNFPRRAHRNNSKHSRNSIPVVDDDDILDLCSGDEEGQHEEEEQDPHDDADVTDREDAANDSNNGEENATSANIFDGLDDYE